MLSTLSCKNISSASTKGASICPDKCYVHRYELFNSPRFSVFSIIAAGQKYKPTPTVCNVFLARGTLEVGHAATVAPISRRAPSQRLILGSTNFTSLGVLLALELGLQALRRIRMKLLATAVHLDLGLRGLVDLRCAESTSRAALKVFEYFLFFLWEARGSRALCEWK